MLAIQTRVLVEPADRFARGLAQLAQAGDDVPDRKVRAEGSESAGGGDDAGSVTSGTTPADRYRPLHP